MLRLRIAAFFCYFRVCGNTRSKGAGETKKNSVSNEKIKDAVWGQSAHTSAASPICCWPSSTASVRSQGFCAHPPDVILYISIFHDGEPRVEKDPRLQTGLSGVLISLEANQFILPAILPRPRPVIVNNLGSSLQSIVMCSENLDGV